MKLYMCKREPINCTSDTVAMVIIKAYSFTDAMDLLKTFNADQTIRSSGGGPIDIEGPDWIWDNLGTVVDDGSPPRILHYVYCC